MRRGMVLGCVSLLAVAFVSGPVIGQNEAPESLLPPGFNDPAPAPSQSEPPPPPEPGRTVQPVPGAAVPLPSTPLPSLAGQDAPTDAELSEELAKLQEELEAQIALTQSLPPSARRSSAITCTRWRGSIRPVRRSMPRSSARSTHSPMP